MDPATFILVIEICADWRNEASRTRELTEGACMVLAQEARSCSTVAYCYRNGEQDPGWVTKEIRPPICAHATWCHGGTTLPGRKRI
jgi:hypothetical protein